MKNAKFYHAGCPVCVNAEKELVKYINPAEVDTEIVHLGEQQNRIQEAEEFGVNSVPALVLDDQVFHINFGASLEEVKNG
tara:strand:- start:5804 stop:6043 length:240 start_codon:yes stop_codon:yes gene_type:complete